MDNTAVKLAPSILAADFARLGEQVAEAERAGADRIHVDVMDGHFVPNLSMGPAIVQSLRRVTPLTLETQLMISDPDAFLDDFAAAGSDSLLVHWRATTICIARCSGFESSASGPESSSIRRRPRQCWRRSSRTSTRCSS
jgi:ribulose-phosphate 3-epimerase